MALSEDIDAIPRLLGNAVEQLGRLVQNETQLAKAELSEKITQAGIGVAYIGGAAILCIPVLVVLLITVALWLTERGLSPVAAHLAAAGFGAIICAILGLAGLSHLKPENLKPEATLREVRRDVATAKELAR